MGKREEKVHIFGDEFDYESLCGRKGRFGYLLPTTPRLEGICRNCLNIATNAPIGENPAVDNWRVIKQFLSKIKWEPTKKV